MSGPDYADVGWYWNWNDAPVPLQTVVRIETVDIEQKAPIVYAVVPGWNSRQVVRFPQIIVAQKLRVNVKPGERFFAKVNIGAEDHADLYFDVFDYRGKIGDV